MCSFFYPKHTHTQRKKRPSDVIINLFHTTRDTNLIHFRQEEEEETVYLRQSMLPLKAVTSPSVVLTSHTASKQLTKKRNIRMSGLFDMLTGKGGEGTPKVNASSIYELPNGTDVDGNEFDYSSLKGKVVLITNVASR